jgi:hypothetical protein
MANAKLVRDGFTIPMPKPGDGTKLMCRPDGSLYCSWDRPPARMALDAALPRSRLGYDADITDIDDNHDGSGDLGDKIRELLTGKLDDGDIEALIRLMAMTPSLLRKIVAGVGRHTTATLLP